MRKLGQWRDSYELKVDERELDTISTRVERLEYLCVIFTVNVG